MTNKYKWHNEYKLLMKRRNKCNSYIISIKNMILNDWT